jgi:hypothetical protein
VIGERKGRGEIDRPRPGRGIGTGLERIAAAAADALRRVPPPASATPTTLSRVT